MIRIMIPGFISTAVTAIILRTRGYDTDNCVWGAVAGFAGVTLFAWIAVLMS